MANFRVLTPLRHDGVTHRPGAIVTMAPEAATRAMACGAVAPCATDELPKTPGVPARKRRSGRIMEAGA
ncbi:MAG: hypothetical protein HQL91_06560 [Magnetococcales bacterium]|nr:hypothetical protein [Magnetococcales bacterium]